jgi:hypothetical protein
MRLRQAFLRRRPAVIEPLETPRRPLRNRQSKVRRQGIPRIHPIHATVSSSQIPFVIEINPQPLYEERLASHFRLRLWQCKSPQGFPGSQAIPAGSEPEFKPSLYLRYDSPIDAVADRADHDWERTIRAYQKHLERFSKGMNERVRDLAERLCLHDAELLSFQEEDVSARPSNEPSFYPGVATLSLKSEGKIVSLIYLLGDEVEESPPPKVWPFSNSRTHWLYDEIDLVDLGKHRLYRHRILLSDGRVISIAFYDVVVHLFAH